MNWFLLAAGLVVVVLVVRQLAAARPGISPAEAWAQLQAGTAVVVDVREPPEWRSGVAAGAARLPLSDLQGTRQLWAPFLAENPGVRLILYCASGVRSGNAARLLRREGRDAVNLGGLRAWAGAGLPLQRPP